MALESLVAGSSSSKIVSYWWERVVINQADHLGWPMHRSRAHWIGMRLGAIQSGFSTNTLVFLEGYKLLNACALYTTCVVRFCVGAPSFFPSGSFLARVARARLVAATAAATAVARSMCTGGARAMCTRGARAMCTRGVRALCTCDARAMCICGARVVCTRDVHVRCTFHMHMRCTCDVQRRCTCDVHM